MSTTQRIVTLGASAGGLAALEAFFKSVPARTGWSFVIVQHLSPDFKSLMGQLLGVYTEMPICEVASQMELEPDHIYLIPAGRLMRIRDGRFHLEPRDPDKMPINAFLQSAAAAFGPENISIIFSGTGSDGTAGCRAIREAGGLVIAQSPESAEFESMPRSVISQRLSHAQAAPEAMWDLIAGYDGNPRKIAERPQAESGTSDALLEDLNIGYDRLFGLLKRLYELDFNFYKITSVSRRIQRRMEQCALDKVEDYLRLLEENPEETNALYRDLLIGVTAFFRDSEVYSVLAEEVIRPAFHSRKDHPEEFRIWVAGCASGEEAYSLAILTDEVARETGFKGNINIFATDIHQDSVERAGRGVYQKPELAEMGESRIDRYFKATDDGSFRIRPEIRKRVIFAQHNLLSDPPFTRMDLVTCRNLLIYLKPQAQELVLRSFHYALKRGGNLLLGTSESLGKLESSFTVVANRAKLFRKSGNPIQPARPNQLFLNRGSETTRLHTPSLHATKVSVDKTLLRAYDALLHRYAPTGVLITPHREVRHIFGELDRFCSIPQGRADSDFLSMLTGDLKLAVSTSIQRALSQSDSIRFEGVRLDTDEGERVLDITVEPFSTDDLETGLLLVAFIPRERPARPAHPEESPPEAFRPDEESQSRILMLEDELRSTKESLQATVEELQTSNEELQAINEEVQVSNEELQSTNEELHSMNEELYTVNSELQQRNQQLIELNIEHENLLMNTEDGVLYVDRELRIKKFNPAIGFAFNLLPQDIGRPVEHIAYNLQNQDEMLEDLRNVLHNGVRKERESRTREGIIYLRRFTPFLDDKGEVAGVVLTFTNITESTQMRDRISRAMRTAGMAWWDWDLTTNRLEVHAEGNCILGYDCDNIGNSFDFWMERIPVDEAERVRQSLNACISGKTSEWVCEHRFLNARGEYEWVLNSGLVNRRTRDGVALEMAGTTMNINNRKLMELDLRASKEAAEAAMVAKSNFLSTMSHEIRTPLNGISGMAELLKMEARDPSIAGYVETINKSSDLLLELINDILDYSKAEAGKIELYLEFTDLKALLDSTVNMLLGKARDKNIHLDSRYRLRGRLFKVDAVRLRQVLLNLLSNAIKFTPEGGRVSVTASLRKENLLEFHVTDTGIGIEPAFRQRLFEPFTQADSSLSRAYGGTGLGLSICKHFVELMGGSIDVESTPTEGSTFHFTVPTESKDDTEPDPAAPSSDTDRRSYPGNLRTLVVDDDRTNAQVIRLMLRKCGIESESVHSGEACLKALQQNPYDLVFLDLHMPEVTGFDVAEKIRSGQCGPHNQDVPLVAFTADVSHSSRIRIENIGFNHLLLKPTSILKICEALDTVIQMEDG